MVGTGQLFEFEVVAVDVIDGVAEEDPVLLLLVEDGMVLEVELELLEPVVMTDDDELVVELGAELDVVPLLVAELDEKLVVGTLILAELDEELLVDVAVVVEELDGELLGVLLDPELDEELEVALELEDVDDVVLDELELGVVATEDDELDELDVVDVELVVVTLDEELEVVEELVLVEGGEGVGSPEHQVLTPLIQHVFTIVLVPPGAVVTKDVVPVIVLPPAVETTKLVAVKVVGGNVVVTGYDVVVVTAQNINIGNWVIPQPSTMEKIQTP